MRKAFPWPETGLMARLADAERGCIESWMVALERLAGNPLRVAVRRFGAATALVCGEIPAEVYNRVFGLTIGDREHVPAIKEFYARHGATPTFDISPYAVSPYWEGENIMGVLARHGFYQGAFHQLLYAVPDADVPAPPEGVRIEEVGRGKADEFVGVYETVWGGGASIRALLGHPEFRCYLAYLGGEPAGLGVLHVANGVGSMANGLTDPRFRGSGCHTALLHRRIRDAALDGCEWLVSQCRPGSVSERNQLRAGFRVACSKAWWVPLPES